MAGEHHDKGFSNRDNQKIEACVKMRMGTGAGTGFRHESFHKDDATKFVRDWSACQNTLSGELIAKLANDGKS